MGKIKVFNDRYRWLGPLIWFFSIEYFVIQLIVAMYWKSPHYNWGFNTISDLGNTVCGIYNGRDVCSPLHYLMNISFILLGLLMASGALLIYQEFREKYSTLIGFILMAIAGFGTIMVGLFPENSNNSLHSIGASLPFILGNLSLIILAISLYKVPSYLRVYTFLSGAIALLFLIFYVTHNYGSLGIGGTERFLAYPQTVWLIFFAVYMMRSRLVKAN